MLVIRVLLFRHFLSKKVSFVLLSSCEMNLIFIKRSSYEVLPSDYYSHLSFSRLNALTKSESHFFICIELLTSRKKMTGVKFPSRITRKIDTKFTLAKCISAFEHSVSNCLVD